MHTDYLENRFVVGWFFGRQKSQISKHSLSNQGIQKKNNHTLGTQSDLILGQHISLHLYDKTII